MLANSFSDQPHMGLSSSGTLSHVYIQHPPLRCGIPETRGVYYDDGNKVLLSPTSDQVLSWKIGHSNQLDPPNSDSISEGSVLSIRYSLDRKVIGIQRSIHEIQFKNRDTGETFSRRCRPDNESILGFFWTDCPICDVIIIKTSGIDLLTYEPELKTLRLLEAKKFSVSWYIYTHESRMILLASGLQCTIFYGFQFSSNGVVRLPKFEMTMCKAEANQKPVLAAEYVHIATIYGRIYCLQLDRVGMQLNLYRFYRDAVVQQGTLPVYSSRIAVSVVDNVLLVHQIDAKVVILYDVFVDSLAPVSAPLPLLLRGPSNTSRQTNNDQGNMNNAYGRMIYGDSWNFLVPDLICDAENGMLWRMYLDMEAIAASSSDIPSLLEFLQRRRSDPSKIKMLCLSIMRTIILERRPIPMIARAIDVLVASYSLSVKLGNSLQGIERRASESFSNIQHIVDSKVVSEEAISSTANHEKDVGQKYLSGPNKSLEKDIKDKTLESASSSVLARSDFNGNANLENLSPERSLSGGSHDTEDRMATQTTGDQIIGVNLDQSQSGFDVERNNSQTEASVSVHQASQNLSVAVSPDEIYHFVLAVVEDEMLGDPSYLVSIVVEFLRSVSKEKFKVHPNVYVMTIQLLARDNRHAELGLFALNKIIEPSKEVALQLLESGRQNLQTKKLGIEMLRQLSLHHDHVSVLLEDGYYLEALRYARRNKIITVRPSLFLEAALASNNSQHLAAVLRFFSDFTPAFKSTSEYDQYHRVLAEMC